MRKSTLLLLQGLSAQATAAKNAFKLLGEEIAIGLLPGMKSLLNFSISLADNFAKMGRGLGIIAGEIALGKMQTKIEKVEESLAKAKKTTDGWGISKFKVDLEEVARLTAELKRLNNEDRIQRVENAKLLANFHKGAVRTRVAEEAAANEEITTSARTLVGNVVGGYEHQLLAYKWFLKQKTEAAKEAEIEQREADKRFEIEQDLQNRILALKFASAGQAASLLRLFAKDNKAFALAALAVEKGVAIASVFVSTTAAAAAALMPPPIGLGPIAGIALASTIKTWGKIQMGLIAATGLAQAAGAGGGPSAAAGAAGSVGSAGTSGTIPLATATPPQPRQDITININNAVGTTEEQWAKIVEDNIAPALNNGIEQGTLTINVANA